MYSTLLACVPALGQPLRPISPERAGFYRSGLARIDEFFAGEIAQDRVPGAVVAIARDGRLVYYKAHGFLQKATGQPMSLDAIFNLAWMTKVMVSVAGLRLNGRPFAAEGTSRPILSSFLQDDSGADRRPWQRGGSRAANYGP
jgi:CubicO group peptidase (beta-lactamase class C family)